jgi:glycosyltransferase involved in cell wall biosynthesis
MTDLAAPADSTLVSPPSHLPPFAVDAANRAPAPAVRPAALTRVLHVVNGEHYSGAERVQDLLAGYLPACGYETSFACVKPGRFPQARQFREARLYELPMRSRLDFRCGRNVAALVRDEGYALVHAHTPRSLMVAAQAARIAHLPMIYHVHSPAGRDSTRRVQNQLNMWLERRAGHRAARLIAVSPSVRRYMLEQGFRASQVICVPNGVPRIDAAPRRQAPASWTLGMAALFRPRKGVEVLLEALAVVRAAGADVRLRAVGPFETPAYERQVRKHADRLHVSSAVDWIGFAGDVAAEFARIDVLVLPSLFGEGLPMVVLESMAAGVPVIASRVEGVPEAIRDGEDGLLFEPSKVRDLVAAVKRLVRSDVDYPAMSRSAQLRHAEHFSAEIMARRVAEVYDQALGK